MFYKSLGKCDLEASVVGLGCEHLEGKDFQTIDRVVKAAIECDINILDVFMSEPDVRSNIGKSLKGQRERVLIQGHIGSVFEKGQYKRSRDLTQNKLFFEDLLIRLDTDYIDIGMIHFIDTLEDYERILNNGILDYAADLKRQGIIKAIGLSSHAPLAALKAIKTGLIDVLMFSINPAYDLLPENTKLDAFFVKDTYTNDLLIGTDPLRAELYNTCETLGVGITVMKTLASGKLLHAKTSPFDEAMSVHQCMHYALTRPGVSSVLIGCRTPEEVYEAAMYIDKTDEEKDYSSILTKTPKYSMTGKCMYCNHCLPCPSHIDIALVTKYLDLAAISDGPIPQTIIEHYKAMPKSARDCIECGNCEPNCPFGVKIIENMRRAKAIF